MATLAAWRVDFLVFLERRVISARARHIVASTISQMLMGMFLLRHLPAAAGENGFGPIPKESQDDRSAT
jgi:hypothetical protein